jgi:hypothetical protein
MEKAQSPDRDPIPPAADWQGPISWFGSPLRPAADDFCSCPDNAVFVRAELKFMVEVPIGPGMFRGSQKTVPGLIRLERGQPVEVHTAGLDDRCWTYRRIKVGRKWRWALFAGDRFPAEDQVGIAPGREDLEYVLVQSVVAMAGSRRHVCFLIGPEGVAEDLSRAVDPDPND